MKSDNTFYAMMARMKYINRWALMRNSYQEDIAQHSMEVAMLSHALALIGKTRFNKTYSPERVAMLGLYHDCTEIITGDMPTPIKYNNRDIRKAYKEIEEEAANRLLERLPEELREEYEPLLLEKAGDGQEWILVKAADKLSALIKCIEEEKAGNQEFKKAKETLEGTLEEMDCPEAHLFCQVFLPMYYKTLDEL